MGFSLWVLLVLLFVLCALWLPFQLFFLTYPVVRRRLCRYRILRQQHALRTLTTRRELGQEELLRLSDLKSKFFALALHELRTPLASIQGFSSRLARQALSPLQARYLGHIGRSAEQIGRWVRDLTDLALLESGKLSIEGRDFELSEFCRDVISSAQVLAEGKGIKFSCPQLPGGRIVHGDPFRLSQVLNNLLGNAVKFTPPGGEVQLEVHVGVRSVLFHVRDTGPGVHPSERRRIFEKFYQSRTCDEKSKKQGWGLGLAIAQEIVQAHRGEIGVESVPSQGATFWVRIPLEVRAISRQALSVAFLGLWAVSAWAQTSPVESKVALEQALQHKSESVLARLLGPGRAQVAIDAALDFTHLESIGMETPPGLGDWSGKTGRIAGLPYPAPLLGLGEPKLYERRSWHPSSPVKRLIATVILDQEISVEQQDKISRVVADIIDLRPERGDVLNVVRVPFASAWSRFWHSSGALGLMKYGAIVFLILLVLAGACWSVFKFAQAMETAISTDRFPIQDFGMSRVPQEIRSAGRAPEPSAQGKVFFEVRLDQVEALAKLLQGQDPENIALVTAHLETQVQKIFLSRLPAEISRQVILSLGQVRFVDPDVILEVKEALERRLKGAIGGQEQRLELLRGLRPELREEPSEALHVPKEPLAAEDASSQVTKDAGQD